MKHIKLKLVDTNIRSSYYEASDKIGTLFDHLKTDKEYQKLAREVQQKIWDLHKYLDKNYIWD